MSTPKTPQRISGVLCHVMLDKNGFVDVIIQGEEIPPHLSEEERHEKFTKGEILLCEWIVRGAITEEEAIRLAEGVIHVRRQGFHVQHDVEGRILKYKTLLGAEIPETKDYDRLE
ncbi:MAG TPA: hypothetical protein VIT23_00700 [Terrimicrobiaceae bacterium]